MLIMGPGRQHADYKPRHAEDRRQSAMINFRVG